MGWIHPEEFSKIFKKFLAYFSKNLTNRALIFRVVDKKHKLLEISEKILKFVDENLIEKKNF